MPTGIDSMEKLDVDKVGDDWETGVGGYRVSTNSKNDAASEAKGFNTPQASRRRANDEDSSATVNSLKMNMETLRGAADKIKNSPRLVRKKINHALNKERLTEDWIHNRDEVKFGVMFNIKILGRIETTEEQIKERANNLIDGLVQIHKVNAKIEKLRKASMLIDCDKLVLRDLVTHEIVEDISVKRICFCSTDQTYPKVFALMVTPEDGSDGFMYAFLTNKKEMADTIALTVAQAYTMSFDDDQDDEKEKQIVVKEEMRLHAKNLYSDLSDTQELETVDNLAAQVDNTTLSIPSITDSCNDDENTSPDGEDKEFKASDVPGAISLPSSNTHASGRNTSVTYQIQQESRQQQQRPMNSTGIPMTPPTPCFVPTTDDLVQF